MSTQRPRRTTREEETRERILQRLSQAVRTVVASGNELAVSRIVPVVARVASFTFNNERLGLRQMALSTWIIYLLLLVALGLGIFFVGSHAFNIHETISREVTPAP